MIIPLSPAQVKNIENALKIPVLDRQGVILSIFKLHAKTSLAKMQVELAQLKYLQPRLTGIWEGLSRQRGAKGGFGGRGGGEKQLELDRRTISKRISFLSHKLKKADTVFETQSKRRSRMKRISLVGYTNAGKSTLMRTLTQTEVLVEDKLFCTLDTTIKTLMPPTEPRLLISDTVGFVRDIPHDLVLSFKSTLQEAVESQMLIHVIDYSHPDWKEHFEVTEKVLCEIGADKSERLFVFNKIDQRGENSAAARAKIKLFLSTQEREAPFICLSALDKDDCSRLRQLIMQHVGASEPAWA